MKTGDIVLVRFPFTNLEKEKKRPALVIQNVKFSRSESLAIIVMITSQIESPEVLGDVLLREWKAASLLHPSRVRLSKFATIEQTLLDSALGSLHSKDLQTVKKEFKKLMTNWLS